MLVSTDENNLAKIFTMISRPDWSFAKKVETQPREYEFDNSRFIDPLASFWAVGDVNGDDLTDLLISLYNIPAIGNLMPAARIVEAISNGGAFDTSNEMHPGRSVIHDTFSNIMKAH